MILHRLSYAHTKTCCGREVSSFKSNPFCESATESRTETASTSVLYVSMPSYLRERLTSLLHCFHGNLRPLFVICYKLPFVCSVAFFALRYMYPFPCNFTSVLLRANSGLYLDRPLITYCTVSHSGHNCGEMRLRYGCVELAPALILDWLSTWAALSVSGAVLPIWILPAVCTQSPVIDSGGFESRDT